MNNSKTLSQIFRNEPVSWGLRGDPFLWRELTAALEDQPYPETETDFYILIYQTYEQLTGKSIREQEDVFVERFSHGGMSSGYVSPPFWTETAIPLLLERYRETK